MHSLDKECYCLGQTPRPQTSVFGSPLDFDPKFTASQG